MTTIIGRHKVRDFKTWLSGHQDRVKLLAPATSSFRTFQDADDPNSIALIIEVTDMKKFKTILETPVSEKLQEKHTVIKPITISLPVDI